MGAWRRQRSLSDVPTTLGRVSGITALGSWPGTDMRTCLRIVRDAYAADLGDGAWALPYVPELPDRGPGGDLIGRSAALLSGLHVDLQPSGWRLVDRPGRDVERTIRYVRNDLDELAEAYDGYAGPLKIQAAGPWTLAAELRVARGERVVVDPGAARDLAQSLAEGLAEHVRAVNAAVPGARIVVQLDEPSLPAVLAGRLPTSSGYGAHRAVDAEVVERGLRTVREAVARAVHHGEPGAAGVDDVQVCAVRAPDVVVHCHAPDAPLPLLRSAGFAAVGPDTTSLGPSGWESVAVTVEAGVGLWAGISLHPRADTPGTIEPLRRCWRDVGLPVAGLGDVVLTPTRGLAGMSPERARAIHELGKRSARALTEVAGE